MPITTTGAGGSASGGGGGSAPTNSVAPVVSGSTTVGSTLTSTSGTWLNSPTQFDYQWESNGINVGLDQNTYITVTADIGNNITCVVTASNAAGAGSATSNSVGPITSGSGFIPSLDFSNPLNSQYYFFAWSPSTENAIIPLLDFSQAINSQYYFYVYEPSVESVLPPSLDFSKSGNSQYYLLFGLLW